MAYLVLHLLWAIWSFALPCSYGPAPVLHSLCRCPPLVMVPEASSIDDLGDHFLKEALEEEVNDGTGCIREWLGIRSPPPPSLDHMVRHLSFIPPADHGVGASSIDDVGDDSLEGALEEEVDDERGFIERSYVSSSCALLWGKPTPLSWSPALNFCDWSSPPPPPWA